VITVLLIQFFTNIVASPNPDKPELRPQRKFPEGALFHGVKFRD